MTGRDSDSHPLGAGMGSSALAYARSTATTGTWPSTTIPWEWSGSAAGIAGPTRPRPNENAQITVTSACLSSEYDARLRQGREESMMHKKLLIATMLAILFATAVAATAIGAAPSGTASTPVNVTNDVYANNEESLGMSPDGEWLAGAWNDWEYNDGCGFSYSTDGGDTWAPESFAPFTAFSNTPGVDPIFPTQFGIAGDPSVVFNPRSSKFDLICQAFGTATGNQIQLLSTTFDPTEADPNADVNLSYGAAAWAPPVAVTTGTSNGSQKGS